MREILDTSLEAYEKVLPEISTRQAQVVAKFFEYPGRDFTNMELARKLGWSVNRVTPRVHELRKNYVPPVLVASKRRECEVTENHAWAWKINANVFPSKTTMLHICPSCNRLPEKGWMLISEDKMLACTHCGNRITIEEWTKLPKQVWV